MPKEPRFKNDSAQPASQEVIDVPFTILKPVPESVTNSPATPTPNPPMQTTQQAQGKKRPETDAQKAARMTREAILQEDLWNSPSIPTTNTEIPAGKQTIDVVVVPVPNTTSPIPLLPPASPQPRSSVTQEVAEATAPSGVPNPKVPTPVEEGMAKTGDDMDKVTKGLGGLDWKGAVGLGAATIMTVGILNSMAQSRQREEARKRNQRMISYGQMPDSFQ